MDEIQDQPAWEDVSRGDAKRAAHFALANTIMGGWMLALAFLTFQAGDAALGLAMFAIGTFIAILPMAIWVKARREKGVVLRANTIELPAVGGYLFFRIQPRHSIAIKEVESFELEELDRSNRYRWSLVVRLKSGSAVRARVGTESVSGLRSALVSIGVPERK